MYQDSCVRHNIDFKNQSRSLIVVSGFHLKVNAFNKFCVEFNYVNVNVNNGYKLYLNSLAVTGNSNVGCYVTYN